MASEATNVSDAIMLALSPDRLMKLNEIVISVERQLGRQGMARIYTETCNALQVLKRAGRVEYVKGRGAGWRRSEERRDGGE